MKAASLKRPTVLARTLLTGLLTVGLLTTAGFAVGDDGSGDDFMTPGGGSSGGIGTVPDLGNASGGLPLPNTPGFLPGVVAPQKPALRLVGSAAELGQVIARTYSVDGTGWFLLAPVQGQMSIEFYGNTVVELDRVAFAHSGVSVQLSVAPNFSGGVAVLTSASGRRAAQSLHAGNLNLKLHRLVRSGLADAGLKLVTKSKQGAKAAVQISSEARLIRFAQNH